MLDCSVVIEPVIRAPGLSLQRVAGSFFWGTFFQDRIRMAGLPAVKYLFADEAGNFDFSAGGSRYFIVTAVSMPDFASGIELLDLRHALAYEGAELAHDGFHASEDKQAVRDLVFKLISTHEVKIDAVILEKRKAHPRIASHDAHFYQLAWHLLFKHIATRCFPDNEQGLVVAGSLGTKKKLMGFSKALSEVVRQHRQPDLVKTASWAASSHPCLQVADYCCWAIQRKFEQGDDRSYVLIQPKISSCFEPFRRGSTNYY